MKFTIASLMCPVKKLDPFQFFHLCQAILGTKNLQVRATVTQIRREKL